MNKADEVMCESCLLRKAKIKFAREPTFALTHGYGVQHICRHCYIEKIEYELKGIKYNLKKQKELLEKENS